MPGNGKSNKNRLRVHRVVDVPLREDGICLRRGRNGRMSSDPRVEGAPLLIGALARHLAVNSGLGLLPRNAGGDLGLLAIDAADADIEISPLGPGGNASLTWVAPPRKEKPNCNIPLKSRPPCSVIRRGLTRRAGSAEPVPHHTTRRRPRSRPPDVRP